MNKRALFAAFVCAIVGVILYYIQVLLIRELIGR